MPNRLTRMKIDEVSLVDAPASEGAYAVLRKSAAGMIPGADEAAQTLLDQHGEAAADAFAAALADLSEPVAKAADAMGGMDALAPAVAGLGVAIGAIFAKAGEDGPDEAAIAAAQDAFLEAVSGEVVEKARKRGKAAAFAACPDCATQGACARMGECAAKIAKADEGDAAGFAAQAEALERVAKAAASFKELNSTREARQRMERMIWALQDSVQSIMADPDVTDKAAMVRQSVAEFDAAVAALTAEADFTEELPMTTKTDTPVAKAADAVPPAIAEELAALRAQVADFEKQRRRESAIAKASTLLPHGGPVAELADLIEKADEADLARLTTIAKALTAQGAEAALFGKAMGASAGAAPDAAVHPLVKVAKAKADAKNARH